MGVVGDIINYIKWEMRGSEKIFTIQCIQIAYCVAYMLYIDIHNKDYQVIFTN